MVDRQLGAAVRQIGNPNLFRALLDNVINATPRHWWQILAIGIAGPVLNGAGYSHVSFGLRKPTRNLRVVDRPVLAEPIEICGLEIDITETCRGAAPEVGLPAGRFAALPIPISTRGVGISNIVFEQIPAFAVFGFFHRVRLLVRLAFETPGIAVSSKLEVVNLPVLPIILCGIGARTRVDGAHLQACFAQDLHGSTAACAGSYHNCVIDSCRQTSPPLAFPV